MAELPLYRLPDLASANGRRIIVTEGEKAADALVERGYTALGTVTGANSIPSDQRLSVLGSREVLLWPDNDDPGRKHMDRVASRLQELGVAANIVTWPDAPQRGDAADFTGSDDDLRALIEAAEPWARREDTTLDAQDDTHLTDLGNSQRMVRHHGHELRYCHPWAKWLIWDGKRWRVDNQGNALQMSKDIPRDIYAEAANCESKDRRDTLSDYGRRSESQAKLTAALALAQPDLAVLPEKFDQHPWLLNVENGTVDLHTGEVRPQCRDDFITKLAPVAYGENADAPRWEKFLNEIMGGSRELVSFLQRAVGYSLTGDVREDALFFLHGAGANGKSTFLNTMLRLLGPYATQAQPDLLMAARTERHPTGVADLFGKRLVATVETEKGRYLAESLVKQLTGRDHIKARRMREDFWQFEPTHKIWVAANHKPRVRGQDEAIWRRILLVPFDMSITKERQDKELESKLFAELPGILNWAVAGCLAWQADGLGVPRAVAEATEDYRQEEDDLGRFFGECCCLGDGLSVKFSELFVRYQDWCGANKEKPISKTAMGRELTERGFTRDKTKSDAWRLGIGLRDGEHQSPSS